MTDQPDKDAGAKDRVSASFGDTVTTATSPSNGGRGETDDDNTAVDLRSASVTSTANSNQNSLSSVENVDANKKSVRILKSAGGGTTLEDVGAVATEHPGGISNTGLGISDIDLGISSIDLQSMTAGRELSIGATLPEDGGLAAAAGGKNSFGVSDLGLSGLGISGVDLEMMIARQRDKLARMQSEEAEFLRNMKSAEDEIQSAAERMCGAVDNRVNELLAAASDLREERASQLENTRKQLQARLASMKYHQSFAAHLLQYGTVADVTRYAPLLHADAERIRNEPLPELPQVSAEAGRRLADLQSFAELDLDEVSRQLGGNVVGHITQSETVVAGLPEGESPYLDRPKLLGVTAVGNGVYGIAFLGRNLYVVRHRSSMVEVYGTTEGINLSRQINVEQMTSPSAIIACAAAECLFVSDSEVLGSSILLYWRLYSIITGISIIMNMNICILPVFGSTNTVLVNNTAVKK